MKDCLSQSVSIADFASREVLGSVRSHRVNSIKVYLTLRQATIMPHSAARLHVKSHALLDLGIVSF